MDITTLIRLLLGGLLLGSIYGLVAFGLSLTFSVSHVLNITHGQFLVLGGLVSYTLFEKFGLHPVITLPLLVVLFGLLGMAFERGLIRPITRQQGRNLLVASILVTLGITFAIEDGAIFLWGALAKAVPQTEPILVLGGKDVVLPVLDIGGVRVSTMRLLALALIVFIAVGTHLFLTRTFMGKAMRAISQDRAGAALVGIDQSRIIMLTYGFGTAMAATAGVFYLVLFNVDPQIGIALTLRALTVIVIGGVGSLPGALIGGIMLGILEVLTGFQFGIQWQNSVTFFLLITVLLVRPQGLFGSVAGGR